MTNFNATLAVGKIGEGRIAKWLRKNRWNILPVYETELDTGKGPRLYTPTREVIATDMFAFNSDRAVWVEAKTKSVFTWYRHKNEWQTGIDLRHYMDYLLIDDATPWPVYLMFLHTCEEPAACDVPYCDGPSPTGLFGHTLKYLRQHEDHRSDNYARGMVYWSFGSLKKLAELEDVP